MIDHDAYTEKGMQIIAKTEKQIDWYYKRYDLLCKNNKKEANDICKKLRKDYSNTDSSIKENIEKVNTIRDSVYQKQIKRLDQDQHATFDMQNEDPQVIIRELTSTIGDFDNGIIPPWLSSIFFAINHRWKREKAKRIYFLLLKLKDFCTQHKNNVDRKLHDAIEKVNDEMKIKIDLARDEFLSEIKQKIEEESDSMLQSILRMEID